MESITKIDASYKERVQLQNHPMKFTVKRSEWLRGEGNENSYLLRNEDNKMCCLGFYSLQCEIKKESISGTKCPRGLHNDLGALEFDKYPEWMKDLHSQDLGFIMIINDQIDLTDSEREPQLTEIFKRNGDEITFVD